jgi:serine/threonine protein phosphatase PrpC
MAGAATPAGGLPALDLALAGGPPSAAALRHGVGAQQGPRETMEDVTQVVEAGHCGFLFATVFDGHAGIAAARYLRDHLYGILGESLTAASLGLECSLEAREGGLCCPLELRAALTECYLRADRQLLRWLAAQPGDEAGAGCTATTALVRPDRVIVANVGDSRAVLSRAGTALDLSTEHRVYGRGPAVASETARVTAAGGWVDDGRVCGVLAVSRAFGDAGFKGEGLAGMVAQGVADEMWSAEFAAGVAFGRDPVTAEPDVLEMALQAGQDEFLVVATDGLWDVMSSQEAVTLARNDLRRGRHPGEVAERLAGLAVRRYTADNAAVVLVDLLGEEAGVAAGAKPPKKGFFGMF